VANRPGGPSRARFAERQPPSQRLLHSAWRPRRRGMPCPVCVSPSLLSPLLSSQSPFRPGRRRRARWRRPTGTHVGPWMVPCRHGAALALVWPHAKFPPKAKRVPGVSQLLGIFSLFFIRARLVASLNEAVQTVRFLRCGRAGLRPEIPNGELDSTCFGSPAKLAEWLPPKKNSPARIRLDNSPTRSSIHPTSP
jgi:hypothetical protein